MHAIGLTHLVVLDVIFLMFGEEYKLRISSSCAFLQAYVTSSKYFPQNPALTPYAKNYRLAYFSLYIEIVEG
jgi:hypothetical protein